MGDDSVPERPSHNSLKRGVKLALSLFGSAFVGLIVGATFGLLAIPPLASLVLSPDYEIRPWDGQFVGEVVGMLIGLYVGMKKWKLFSD
jgi:hypothetical protein